MVWYYLETDIDIELISAIRFVVVSAYSLQSVAARTALRNKVLSDAVLPARVIDLDTDIELISAMRVEELKDFLSLRGLTLCGHFCCIPVLNGLFDRITGRLLSAILN